VSGKTVLYIFCAVTVLTTYLLSLYRTGRTDSIFRTFCTRPQKQARRKADGMQASWCLDLCLSPHAGAGWGCSFAPLNRCGVALARRLCCLPCALSPGSSRPQRVHRWSGGRSIGGNERKRRRERARREKERERERERVIAILAPCIVQECVQYHVQYTG
jgi:hypothetical protein